MIYGMSAFLLFLSKKDIINEKGTKYYSDLKKQIKYQLKLIVPNVPEIGDSIFRSSYIMGVIYIAWYKSFLELGMQKDEANIWIWRASENSLKIIPKNCLWLVKKAYIGGMLKKAESHTKKSIENKLPEYDWKIEYKKVNENEFYLNTYECGIKKLCKLFNTEEMLPSLCRLDYLTSHYLGSGFLRDKTLGDGDELCNNKFFINGICEWSPEKGFISRK
ncbi:L-2-amino-thiazoline-4-carboxylic acid hydrolase [Treponema zuelzerae]|uniref:L-2-amino-thiazoline-4-carboxylic acid hydrolase n=1 Tax=Teretinema zuelzerae TaxID=156 RepID=A0AAE3JK00_9SPIR|nr:L-2-amino-thiazoline-4-carboxylic acid hydrolase [Teretinema zuelzerae]MCD1655961.1 L-2-amino-thiazoline-4-carboxylic acid hydrolase [Teretinema zuelzerae]